ncbi:MAG: hypothetical protein H0W72_18215, partial [Planctomycetes bacterium]|nr:hypothetical protein [Planctomycetota bacterium]
MTTLEKLLFTCAACGYRAKIPAHYSGRSIHCPGCRSVQPVGAVVEAGAPATGNTVVLHKVDAVGSGAHPVVTSASATAPGGSKILFTCPACSYKGKLGAEYDGKTIRCPGCQVPQVVKGSPVPSPIVASLAADEPAFSGNDNEKMRFECTKCSYRARIPAKYAGKPIHCPQCKDVQIAKTETDLEESTGRTVTITRVTPAAVKEARSVGAMTNVGVQFTCAVCGFTSKISPSCAGDAIYCPSCRAPQKVEWGPPADAAAPAASAAADSLNIDLPPLEAAPAAPAAKPAQVAKPAPRVASAAPVAKVAMPTSAPMGQEIEVSDVFAAIKPEPKAAPVVSKHGSRRVISMTPQADAPAAHPAAAAAPAPVAAPSARPASD